MSFCSLFKALDTLEYVWALEKKRKQSLLQEQSLQSKYDELLTWDGSCEVKEFLLLPFWASLGKQKL